MGCWRRGAGGRLGQQGLVWAALFFAPGPAGAQVQVLGADQVRLMPGEGTAGDTYGRSVATDGVRVVVGAPRLGSPTARAGYADVYLLGVSGPVLEARLVGAAGVRDHLGVSVALAGEILAVGAPYSFSASSPPGEVHVLSRVDGAWQPESTLVPPDGTHGNLFGFAIALDETRLYVGAPFHSVQGYESSGAVYVYERPQPHAPHALVAKLTPAAPQFMGHFGWQLAARGELVAIGSPRASVAGPYSGAVHLFERGVAPGCPWLERATLVGSDSGHQHRFGHDLALAGGLLAVGAPWADQGRGAAYLFEPDADGVWQEVARLGVEATGSNDAFGSSVAITGPAVAVGASGSDEPGAADAGSVSVFQREGQAWHFTDRLSAAGAQADEGFGSALAVRHSTLVVGAPLAREGGAQTGAAFLHHVPLVELGRVLCVGAEAACPCLNPGGPGEGCANSTGRGAFLRASGSTSVLRGDLSLWAEGLPPQGLVLLFVGSETVHGGAGMPFGEGLRCVQGAVRRLGVVRAGVDGSAELGALLRGAPAPSPGDARVYQVLYPDPAGQCATGFNLSAGLELVATL